jgi:hypothetical protein
MRRLLIVLFVLSLPLSACAKSEPDDTARRVSPAASPAEPDYSAWNRLLAMYYDPAGGMDYAGLKARDSATLRDLRNALGRVDATRLTSKQQLAYWINLYNVSVVGVVVDHYPVESILDISSNCLIRHDVFKRPWVSVPSGRISLNDIENEKIRAGFKDPRIHFAINCAAKSCPPIRSEAYVGARIDAQLDDQVRRFVAGSGVRVERRGQRTVVYTSKIMKWFRDDFEKWGSGEEAFLRRYLPREKAVPLAPSIAIEYDDYDWTLNDWRR